MIGQICVNDITDFKDAEYKLRINKKNIIAHANSSCQSMVMRGGGVEDLKFRKLGEEFLVVELLVNV
jgi:hydroxymethylglutaryl-CoA reductase